MNLIESLGHIQVKGQQRAPRSYRWPLRNEMAFIGGTSNWVGATPYGRHQEFLDQSSPRKILTVDDFALGNPELILKFINFHAASLTPYVNNARLRMGRSSIADVPNEGEFSFFSDHNLALYMLSGTLFLVKTNPEYVETRHSSEKPQPLQSWHLDTQITKEFAIGRIDFSSPHHEDAGFIGIDDKSGCISRTHCWLIFEDGQVIIQDRSQNGTFVNGEKIPHGKQTLLISDEDSASTASFDISPTHTITISRSTRYPQVWQLELYCQGNGQTG